MYRSHLSVVRTTYGGDRVRNLVRRMPKAQHGGHDGSSAWVGDEISAIRGSAARVGTSIRIVQGRVKPDLNPDYYL